MLPIAVVLKAAVYVHDFAADARRQVRVTWEGAGIADFINGHVATQGV